MGGPKWRLEIGGRSFLAQILQTLGEAEIDRVVCVAGGQFTASVQRLFPGVTVVTNDKPDEGMLSSVKIGLVPLATLEGVLTVHVDHPLVLESTYRALVAKFGDDPGAVVKPVHQGRSGHPILIPQGLFKVIMQSDNRTSLNELIRASDLRQLLLCCDDPGIVNNLNTKLDLAAVGR